MFIGFHNKAFLKSALSCCDCLAPAFIIHDPGDWLPSPGSWAAGPRLILHVAASLISSEVKPCQSSCKKSPVPRGYKMRSSFLEWHGHPQRPPSPLLPCTLSFHSTEWFLLLWRHHKLSLPCLCSVIPARKTFLLYLYQMPAYSSFKAQLPFSGRLSPSPLSLPVYSFCVTQHYVFFFKIYFCLP